tara:strand:- start:323 stop:1234 length:912 start_codon:yes stop_codon:yes gene_type:complete
MIKIKIENEYSQLKTVILGIASDIGEHPSIIDTYDPRSLYHVKNNTFPTEMSLVKNVESFYDKLLKHNVNIIRPKNIPNCNQIFSRDLGFVISNIFFMSNIVPARANEIHGIDNIIEKLDVGVIKLPQFMHIEGGDLVLHNNKLFIGTYLDNNYSSLITARTNIESVEYLKKMIPNIEIIPIEIKKSNTNIFENTLHLDCCFQTIGLDKAIICPDGFKNKEDYEFLIKFFGRKNVFLANLRESFMLISNVFVISPEVVVSHTNFKRLNKWLEEKGILVEKVDYSDVSKMSGLFRCSTLPLCRE